MKVERIESYAEIEKTTPWKTESARANTLYIVQEFMNYLTKEQIAQYVAKRAIVTKAALSVDGVVKVGHGWLRLSKAFMEGRDGPWGSYTKEPAVTPRQVSESRIDEISATALGTGYSPKVLGDSYRQAMRELQRNFAGIWIDGVGFISLDTWRVDEEILMGLRRIKMAATFDSITNKNR